MRKKDETPIMRQVILDAMKEFPNIPKRRLARIIYARNPDGYKSMEQVRDFIRYYTGNRGVKDKNSIIKKYGEPIQYTSESQ